MIVISKEEAKMLRKKFPGVHMVTTVNKTMVDELPYVLQAFPTTILRRKLWLRWSVTSAAPEL